MFATCFQICSAASATLPSSLVGDIRCRPIAAATNAGKYFIENSSNFPRQTSFYATVEDAIRNEHPMASEHLFLCADVCLIINCVPKKLRNKLAIKYVFSFRFRLPLSIRGICANSNK